MAGIAALLVALGIIGLIWGGMQKFKAGRLSNAPFVKTGEAATSGEKVAGPKGAISVEGDVKCPTPLTSPCTGTACLYYELEVEGTWKEGDAKKSKKYVEEKKAAEFVVDDGSGAVKIVAEKGGDFEPFDKTFDETKKEGFFADLKSAVGKGEPIKFGQYAFANPPMSKADTFKCVEKVLKVQPRLYVVGKHEAGAISSPSWTSLILSAKSREEVMGATAKAAKMFLIGGGAVVGVGLILGIISMVISKPSADLVASPTAIEGQANPAADAGAVKPDGAQPTTEGTGEVAANPAPETTCDKASRCCKIVTKPAKAKVCDDLTGSPEPKCKVWLAKYKKAVKLKAKARLAECQ